MQCSTCGFLIIKQIYPTAEKKHIWAESNYTFLQQQSSHLGTKMSSLKLEFFFWTLEFLQNSKNTRFSTQRSHPSIVGEWRSSIMYGILLCSMKTLMGLVGIDPS